MTYVWKIFKIHRHVKKSGETALGLEVVTKVHCHNTTGALS